MNASTFRGSTLLLSLLLAGYGCSSDSGDGSAPLDDGSNPNGSGTTSDELGPPPNTGIPGAPLASATPFTAKRPATIDLDYLTNDNGASLRLKSENDLYAADFNALGDVNGDGTGDFMFSTSEKTTVVFGDGQRLHANADGDSFANTQGFTLAGIYRFAGVGDVNGDGMGDLAWTTYDSTRDATGVRVVFGRSDGHLQQAIEAPVAGVDGYDLVNSLRLGDIREVQAAGDFNADGVGDLLVGAYALNGDDPAAPNAWVVYGSASTAGSSIDVAALDADQGLTLVSPLSADQLAAVYDDTGTGYNASITGGFDLNGDDVGDIAIGTYRFDWISQGAEARTYVVYGSAARSADVIDMATLDGVDGLRISAIQAYSPAPDRVSAAGDIDADGHADLALIGDDGIAFVFYSSQGMAGPVVDRENLPAGVATQLTDSDNENTIAIMRGVGDLDGDSADELGIEYSSGQAAILYGRADQRIAEVDLSTSGSLDVTRLSGGGDALSIGDDQRLIALGDIDSDGIDDLGWGWTTRSFNKGIVEIGDINDDGVNDLQFDAPDIVGVSLLRVLYGFGDSGFTGVLASTLGPVPIARVEEGFYDQLLTAMDDAARVSLNMLNDALLSGTDPGPAATTCMAGSAGVDTADVQQFSCTDAPLALGFDWGGGKYSGSAEARFEAVNRQNDELQQLHYRSYPLPTEAPTGSPYQANVTYAAGATLLLETANQNAEGCSIDPQTRQTLDAPDTCSWLVKGAHNGLNGVFGTDSTVRNLRILP